MICNTCGTNNEAGFKFCVKCGCNLDDPSEVNYEQVDMGGYHTEEEFSEENGAFTMDSGTFTIRTSAPPASSLYTADELNQSEEEFDFSIYDDSAAPAAAPQPTASSMNQQPIQPPPMMNNMPNMTQPMQGIPNMPQQPIMPSTQTMGAMQQPIGMNPYQQPMKRYAYLRSASAYDVCSAADNRLRSERYAYLRSASARDVRPAANNRLRSERYAYLRSAADVGAATYELRNSADSAAAEQNAHKQHESSIGNGRNSADRNDGNSTAAACR